jgi:hypothetical protein
MLKLLQHRMTMNVYIGKLVEGSRPKFLVLDANFLKYLIGFYISETGLPSRYNFVKFSLNCRQTVS